MGECGRHALQGSIHPLYIYWATNEIDAHRPARAVCHASRHRDHTPHHTASLSLFSLPAFFAPSLPTSLPALTLSAPSDVVDSAASATLPKMRCWLLRFGCDRRNKVLSALPLLLLLSLLLFLLPLLLQLWFLPRLLLLLPVTVSLCRIVSVQTKLVALTANLECKLRCRFGGASLGARCMLQIREYRCRLRRNVPTELCTRCPQLQLQLQLRP